jgi:hypothetical protein
MGGEPMTSTNRHLPLAILVAGVAWVNSCGRTEMDLLARVSDNAGGATAGQTGRVSGGAGGGDGEISQTGTGGISAGGAGGGTSGVCGDALCLAALFQTCVPEGNCASHGGGSPSASFSDACYSNGVTVSNFGTYQYSASNVIASLTVSRNNTLCYNIETWSKGEISYIITDGKGEQVATGIPGNDGGSIIVTCNGSKPTTVSYACLEPISDGGECTLETCP